MFVFFVLLIYLVVLFKNILFKGLFLFKFVIIEFGGKKVKLFVVVFLEGLVDFVVV